MIKITEACESAVSFNLSVLKFSLRWLKASIASQFNLFKINAEDLRPSSNFKEASNASEIIKGVYRSAGVWKLKSKLKTI
ncbi:hypothetical protein [[Eubacterium] cellulosolvens]